MNYWQKYASLSGLIMHQRICSLARPILLAALLAPMIPEISAKAKKEAKSLITFLRL